MQCAALCAVCSAVCVERERLGPVCVVLCAVCIAVCRERLGPVFAVHSAVCRERLGPVCSVQRCVLCASLCVERGYRPRVCRAQALPLGNALGVSNVSCVENLTLSYWQRDCNQPSAAHSFICTRL